jgi:hypothetical protein
VAGELHGQVTGEAIRTLDDDAADPIAGDAVEHCLEPRPLSNGISAAHRRMVELADKLASAPVRGGS